MSRGHNDDDHVAQTGTGSGGADSLSGVVADARDGDQSIEEIKEELTYGVKPVSLRCKACKPPVRSRRRPKFKGNSDTADHRDQQRCIVSKP